MSLSTALAPEILEACLIAKAETAAALSRALDGRFAVTPGEPVTVDPGRLPALLEGPGLLVVFTVGDTAAALAIPEASGMLPDWYTAPDATGASKLATLAQELSMLLLPEAVGPDSYTAQPVDSLAATLPRGGLGSPAAMLPLHVIHDTTPGEALLLWPFHVPQALREAAPPAQAAAASLPELPHDLDAALPVLPKYTRSLLKIRVPIVVTLARSKQPLSRIVELAPGSIIPFEKSCDDTLSLEVNNREVAAGEVVKVGEKFGLRITSMILPPERFLPLKGRK